MSMLCYGKGSDVYAVSMVGRVMSMLCLYLYCVYGKGE